MKLIVIILLSGLLWTTASSQVPVQSDTSRKPSILEPSLQGVPPAPGIKKTADMPVFRSSSDTALYPNKRMDSLQIDDKEPKHGIRRDSIK